MENQKSKLTPSGIIFFAGILIGSAVSIIITDSFYRSAEAKTRMGAGHLWISSNNEISLPSKLHQDISISMENVNQKEESLFEEVLKSSGVKTDTLQWEGTTVIHVFPRDGVTFFLKRK